MASGVISEIFIQIPNGNSDLGEKKKLISYLNNVIMV